MDRISPDLEKNNNLLFHIFPFPSIEYKNDLWKSAYMVDFISNGIRLGQMCDLSRDVVAGLPVISMLGDCEVFIENYRGILEYSSEYLKVSTKIGNISHWCRN